MNSGNLSTIGELIKASRRNKISATKHPELNENGRRVHLEYNKFEFMKLQAFSVNSIPNGAIGMLMPVSNKK